MPALGTPRDQELASIQLPPPDCVQASPKAAPTAASALTKPAPTLAAPPEIAVAVAFSAAVTSAGVKLGFACRISAPTAAASGAAAEVPKNEPKPDTLVPMPSGAVKSTLFSVVEVSTAPVLEKVSIVPGPTEEKVSAVPGVDALAAATVFASASNAWPNTVPEPWPALASPTVALPKTMYFSVPGLTVPLFRLMARLKSVLVWFRLVNCSSWTGSEPATPAVALATRLPDRSNSLSDRM